MKFTEKQRQAIEIINKNVIVSAGAGSGKTAVLTEKVRYLVKEYHYHLNDMLLLTFTNLAADEMKERIRMKLKDEFPLEADKVDIASICTFDAYALSLVKKYHLVLNLDENIDIISSSIMDVKRREWIDVLFQESYEKEDPEFLNLIKHHCFRDDKNMKDLLFSLLKEAEDPKESFLEEEETSYRQLALAAVQEEENSLLKLQKELYDAFLSVDSSVWKEKVASKYEEIFTAKTIDDFSKILSFPRLPSLKDEDEDEQIDLFKSIRDELKKKISFCDTKENILKEWIENKKDIDVLKRLARKIDDIQKHYKMSNMCFEFADIARFAYQLVKEHKDICQEISESFKIIMVDEYQDTSFAQEKFLLEIERNNLFMVGDIKQSIYRFRNARPEIFKEKYLQYSKHQNGEKIDLNENFRSRKEVLQDINKIFSNIMTLEYGDADYAKEHMISFGNKDYLDVNISEAQTTFLTYDKVSGMSPSELEARLIASDLLDRIQKTQKIMSYENDKPKTKNVDFSSFCILMDRAKDFVTYQRVFEEMGIPLNVVQNEDIMENELMEIIKNVFVLFLDLSEQKTAISRHAFASLARSFLYQISDEELDRIFKNNAFENSPILCDMKNILKERKTLSLVELLDLFYEKTNIYEKIIQIGNVENHVHSLLSYRDSFKEMDRLEFGLNEVVSFFEGLKEYKVKYSSVSSPSGENAVKLMNIHKSKGLEFPICYFAGLWRNFNMQDQNIASFVSQKYGIIFQNSKGKNTIFHDLYREKERKEDLSEKIRLFYVALTRAREQMIFLMPNVERKDKKISNAKSFYDFLMISDFSAQKKEGKIMEKAFHKAEEIQEKLPYEDNTILLEKDEKKRKASKKLEIKSDGKALSLGEQLHFYMQITDFYEKDVSFLPNSFEKKIIQKFLNSSLAKQVIQGKIYKEYEFENQNTKGIIDLFSVREKDILLVDYKLKNMEDDAYKIQLKIYASYLENAFHLPVQAYLYSLLTGEIQKVDLVAIEM